ncbi:MAG: sulfite exporter TauE/SafE family protein [Sphingobium sp.]
MLTDPLFLIAAIVAVTLIGFAKGGFSGLGALATPILALAVNPVQAAAILLPILIASDAVSVWSFRHSWNKRIVAIMLPGALLGVGVGWFMAAALPATVIMAALGLISVAFGAWRLWVERGGKVPAPSRSFAPVGVAFGFATGLTSQIAHAGGPPFQMWVSPQRLPHTEFVGTSAILFAIINLAKLPAYLALGEFTKSNLSLSAALIPLALLSTLAGVWLIKRMHGGRFYTIVHILMIGLGLKLIADSL